MALIKRSRTLRPSSRATDSPYKVDTGHAGPDDILRLTIRDEAAPLSPVGIFEYRGRDLAGETSVHFVATRSGPAWQIAFSGALPYSATLGSPS